MVASRSPFTPIGSERPSEANDHRSELPSEARTNVTRRSNVLEDISFIERELKVEVPDDFVVPAFEGFEELSNSPVRLHAIYWDTAGLTLAGWGHTLRSRQATDGSEQGWTLKLAGDGDGHEVDLAVRREINLDGQADTPPIAALDIVRGIVGHTPMRPVAVIDTVRNRRRLRHLASGTLIEVDDDAVTSQVSGVAGPSFREIEIEVLNGDTIVLKRAGKLLRRAGAAMPEPTPKLLRVLAGQHPTPVLPVRRQAPVTVADLVRGAIADGTRQLLIHDPAIRLGAGIEDIHKARVATRRLRSDLQTLGPLCDEFRVEGLRRELAWLATMLGHVRDSDVLGLTLTAKIEEMSGLDPAAVTALQDRLGKQRHSHLAVLLDVMRSSRYHGLIADLTRLAHEPPLRHGVDPEAPVERLAQKLTARAFTRLERRIERLGEKPPVAALHDVRKAAKRARYAAELMTPLSQGKTHTLGRRLAKLQDQLGTTQDTITMLAWLAELPINTMASSEAFAAGAFAQAFSQDIGDTPTNWRRAWAKASRPKHLRWLK